MTLTDVAGLPAEIRASLARAGIAQEAACDAVDMSRSTYYRRQEHPDQWKLGDLVALLRNAGYGLRLELAPIATVEHTGRASSTGEPTR
jgi:hypothetical protein